MSISATPKPDWHNSSVKALTPEARRRWLTTLSDHEALALLYDWRFWARPNQVAPGGQWYTWMLMAGRGFGKTRSGAEWVREQIEVHGARRVALVARTAADVRDVMVEGESGLMAISPPWFRPEYEPSKRRLTWPNGAIATTYSGDQPEQLRGPQHDAAWCDELAAWRYPDAWDQLLFGLRLGRGPRVVVTTTPRPVAHIRDLAADPDTALTTGHTMENAVNLAGPALAKLLRKYGGTRLGRQELEGKLLLDVPGALWKLETLDAGRVLDFPPLVRVVVGIDPAVTSGEDADETGIVVAGLGDDGHGYVLEDASLRGTPAQWASAAITALNKYSADRIVAETNNGGEMVEHTLRTVDRHVPYHAVHASRGKLTRAEPVAALYEQGRVHHLGVFAELEDQMRTWLPGDKSPDRMDALVWALTALMVGDTGPGMSTAKNENLYRRGRVGRRMPT